MSSHNTSDSDSSQDVIGRDVLEARISVLEDSLRSAGALDTDAIKPGGKENPDTSATGLLYYLCQLHRHHDRLTQSFVGQPTNSSRWDSRAMDDVRAAMAREPVHVQLSIAHPNSGQTKWAVYPKSDYALYRAAIIDTCLQWTAVRYVALEEADATTDSLIAQRACVDLLAKLHGEYAWIATHPGPDVPWGDTPMWDPDVPILFRSLDTIDNIAIRKAFLEINIARVNAISQRIKAYAQGGGDTMPLPAFLGIMAAELKQEPENLARKWTLGEVFASAWMRWEAHEREKKASEKESAR